MSVPVLGVEKETFGVFRQVRKVLGVNDLLLRETVNQVIVIGCQYLCSCVVNTVRRLLHQLSFLQQGLRRLCQFLSRLDLLVGKPAFLVGPLQGVAFRS